MKWSLAHLKPVHLVVLTAAYWLGLALTKLGSAILAAWQVSLLPSGHGTITASLDGARLSLTIAKDKVALWSGSASVAAIVMWVVGPPLVLALTRRWAREVDVAAEPGAGALGEAPAGRHGSLPSPRPSDQRPESQTTRVVNPRPPGAERPTPPSGRGH
jgi:hypothetical protein